MADLLSLLPPGLMGELGNALRLLDRFYIPTRYPDAVPEPLPGGVPRQTDAEEALDLARRALLQVENKL